MTEYIRMRGQPRRELAKEHAHGYELEEVVADLVDNSIDAGAENIRIVFAEEEYGNRKSFFLNVLDDGFGISPGQISSVMDFGADRIYEELDLGKFGVGMKSSSLSQAKEITLLSKVSGGNIELRRLSSEIVHQRDEWVLIDELEDHMFTDAISIAKNNLSEMESGTCIVLENMHKLTNRIGTEAKRQDYMTEESVIIRDYLGLVFERYIQGVNLNKSDFSSTYRKVNIYLNGNEEINKVVRLDPFCVDKEDGTVTGTIKKTWNIEVNLSGYSQKIPLTIWIIPKSEDRADYCNYMDDDYDHRMKNASRDAGISELQGLYIYRNQRLINFAGWHRICKHDPHYTCDRWEIHFPPSLDNEFQLDPSKRDVRMPAQVIEQLNQISRKSVRWHPDDEGKASAHRPRAKKRQGGHDAPRISITTPTGPSHPTSPPGDIVPKGPVETPGKRGNPPSYRPVIRKSPTAIEVKKIGALPEANLVVSERISGTKYMVTLNSNHPLYDDFIKKINSF
jgi:hypothetical protein